MRRMHLGFQRVGYALLGLAGGIVVGCFDAPAADVMFSCDPATAPACPDGYSCEADGCCHRDGTDVAANLGACKLGGDTQPGTGTGTGTGTTAVDNSDSSSSDSGGTTSI